MARQRGIAPGDRIVDVAMLDLNLIQIGASILIGLQAQPDRLARDDNRTQEE